MPTCIFDHATFRFRGSAVAQARCLLRKVLPMGNVSNSPATLPAILETLVGNVCDVSLGRFAAYLTANGIDPSEIGGNLEDALCTTNGTAGSPATARYFIIHDTSTPHRDGQFTSATATFPASVNAAAWKGNNLSLASGMTTHVLINRLGKSAIANDYKKRLRATKRERMEFPGNKEALTGLFLHHELVQPRLNNKQNIDEFSPDPGFPEAQYERLAVCYVAAAVRGGTWMVPAFHCVLDLGIPDGHDDPQHFELAAWGAAIERVRSAILGVVPDVHGIEDVPDPDMIQLRSPGMRGDPVLEAVADGHMILRASGGIVAGIGPVQDGLNQLGFTINLGTGDKFRGFFGDKTKGAVLAFQEATPGIHDATGTVNQETILALDAALAKPPGILKPPTGIPMPLIAEGELVATLKEKPGGAGALRDVKIFKLPGRVGYYYNAAMAIDVDGSPRAYSAGADHPTPLDGPDSVDAEGFATMYIQQRVKTVHGATHMGEGPLKDFFVSRTSLFFREAEAFKTSNFVDAELIPFVVFPDTPAKFPGTHIGDMAYVIDLRTRRSTHAIFADTNPKVGEASLRVAQNLGRTNLNAGNGDEDDRYVYIVFPGTKFTPLDTVPHWPDEKIKEEADNAFAAWGGMAQVEKLFG